MIAPTYPWQQAQPLQPVQPTQPARPVATPFFPPTAQVVPPQPVPHYSSAVLLHEAETLVPTLQSAHMAVLHGVAVLMLTQPGQGFHPAPPDVQQAHVLAQGQLLTLHNGGYILTALGHAVLAVFESNAIG